jgi:hypothetical protein
MKLARRILRWTISFPLTFGAALFLILLAIGCWLQDFIWDDDL